jgi:hypothetical protein
MRRAWGVVKAVFLTKYDGVMRVVLFVFTAWRVCAPQRRWGGRGRGGGAFDASSATYMAEEKARYFVDFGQVSYLDSLDALDGLNLGKDLLESILGLDQGSLVGISAPLAAPLPSDGIEAAKTYHRY